MLVIQSISDLNSLAGSPEYARQLADFEACMKGALAGGVQPAEADAACPVPQR